MEKTLRMMGKILSWIGGLAAIALAVLIIWTTIDIKDSSITSQIDKWVDTISSYFLGVLSSIIPQLQDWVENWIKDEHIVSIIIAVIIGLLGIVSFVVSISSSKISNILEIIVGVAFLLFFSWIISIFLIAGGILKLFTKKHYPAKARINNNN